MKRSADGEAPRAITSLPPPFGGGLIEATSWPTVRNGSKTFRPRLGAASLKRELRMPGAVHSQALPPPFGGGLIEAGCRPNSPGLQRISFRPRLGAASLKPAN